MKAVKAAARVCIASGLNWGLCEGQSLCSTVGSGEGFTHASSEATLKTFICNVKRTFPNRQFVVVSVRSDPMIKTRSACSMGSNHEVAMGAR